MRIFKVKERNSLGRSLRRLAFSGLLLTLVGSSFAAPLTDEVESKDEITVWVDDIRAIGSFRAEDVREDLLRQAFADAASREKWIGNYDFEYNGSSREAGQAGISLRVINWDRSPAGSYNFTVAADYWDADGEKIALGTFHGIRSSIVVSNVYDVADQFAGSAEDAFRDALRKLKKKTIES